MVDQKLVAFLLAICAWAVGAILLLHGTRGMAKLMKVVVGIGFVIGGHTLLMKLW